MRPTVAIVGAGRLGTALGLGLSRAKWKVSMVRRAGGSAGRAPLLGLPLATDRQLGRVDLCVIAVPDRAVAAASAEIAPRLGASTALVHCAGALGLRAFGAGPALRRPRGSFHPLCAVSSPSDSLSGHAVAISASDDHLLEWLKKMAAALQMQPIAVPEKKRLAYHAGAMISAGGIVALASASVAAFQAAGIDESQALTALLPLMRSALTGIEKRGLAAALTGPIARGDEATVAGHLAALPANLVDLYRELALRSLHLTGKRLSGKQRKRLEEILRSVTRSR
ncbi:MAG TPA: DUF2520 domain-containing protein [Myxococcaceae bacterium]|nr:DUF2520 domain-containing protein [Myxococcaceae bacterium]